MGFPFPARSRTTSLHLGSADMLVLRVRTALGHLHHDGEAKATNLVTIGTRLYFRTRHL